MQNIVFEKPYEFIPPHRGNLWPTIIQRFRLIDRWLRKSHGITSYECRHAERLRWHDRPRTQRGDRAQGLEGRLLSVIHRGSLGGLFRAMSIRAHWLRRRRAPARHETCRMSASWVAPFAATALRSLTAYFQPKT